MGKLNAAIHSLTAGEVSNAALARVDQERLRLAAEIQENLFPHVIGKGMFRPGTKYLGATASNTRARYLPFVKAPNDTAIVEMTSALMRVWISDALLTRASVTSTVANSSFATASATVTISNASPGVITWTAHGIAADQPVAFTTTGGLPTGLTASTTYYVKTVLSVDTFTVSATVGGVVINTSSVGSGVHTGYHGWTPTLSPATLTVATVAMTGGNIELYPNARGAFCYAEQAVTTSTTGTEHALRIEVTRGPVLLRVGSTSGGEDYVTETLLDTGTHSIAFTPSASPYYVRFIQREQRKVIIASCVVESAGVVTIAAPWSEADLPLIRHAQSIDIIYLACSSWQQRKIERRGSTGRSWSLVKYETDDGPFRTAPTNKVRMTPGAAYGVTTMTASSATFSTSHVGSLIKLNSKGQSVALVLAGEDTYSEPIRLYGVGATHSYTYAITGTWVGTISVQNNFDSGGADTGYADTGVTYVVNASGTEATGATYDNVVHFVRFGFKAGGYTSGAATVAIGNAGGGGDGVFRIVAYNSATSVDVQVLSPPASLASTDDWSFGAWSDVNGWPSAVGLFDGRLFWGAQDKFWGSESDGYTLYNLDDEGDSGSIQRAIATGGTINKVKWMMPLQRLILGTDGAEVSIRSSSFDEPLTPTNITLKDASTQGAAAFSPVKMDGRGIFIHRDGLRLFEMVYDGESNDYRAGSLMLLNDTIGGTGFSGLAVQRSPETYVWTVRADGQCPILIYEPKEKTAGWIRFIAGPSVAGVAVVEDVLVLPSTSYDRVYLAIKRTINGSVVRYFEKLATHAEAIGGATTNLMADSHVTLAGPVTTFTGLTHLVGETVVAWGTTGGITGPIGTTYIVNGSGEITLPSSSTNVTVGLAYNWRYKSAKLAYAAQGGTALLQIKRAAEIGLLLENTHPNAILFGSDFTTMYELPRVENGQDITETTVWTTYDEPISPFGGGWDTDSRLCMKGSAPYPVTIAGIVLGIETNET